MTEDEACYAYAVAWNSLSPDVLIDKFDDDIRYTSQWVFDDINGKKRVSDYLRGKMDTMSNSPDAKVFAQLAETQPYPMYPNPPQPCVVVSQKTQEKMIGTVLFEVSKTGISAIDFCCIPPPESTKRSGDFPD
ncbi:hypothetical protein ACFL17_08200 [Pseudomonadota bacterium]